MKAREIMELLFSLSFERDYSNTCDTLKAGDPEKEVSKVAVSMFATPKTIAQAKTWGADMLIVHEPTYYDHWDRLTDEAVRLQKQKLIEESGLTLYRYHDHPHFCQEDLIAKGMVAQMQLPGKADYVTPGALTRITLDTPMTAAEVAKHLETHCGIHHIRISGAKDIPSTKISGMFGTPDGVMQELQSANCEILLTGEACEWSLAEYARDAAQLGYNKTLLILGHIGSEAGGMLYIADLLAQKAPALSVRYFASGEVYTYTDET